MIVYQVVNGLYCIGETQETIYGTYSTKEKAEERKNKLIKDNKIDMKHTFIYEIEIDKDVEE
jgi:hypothetical protein